MQARDNARREPTSRPGRRQSGVPEHLVTDQVADAGDAGLVEQAGFDRRIGAGERPLQLGASNRPGVRAESGEVRVELDATESSRIAHSQRAPIGEIKPEAIPLRLVTVARVPQ